MSDPSVPGGVNDPDDVDLSLAEFVCLSLIAESPRHGWALVKELGPGGELGTIWSLSRALTYRAIDQLEAKGLIVRGAAESGRGPTRVALDVTPDGRLRADHWLAAPVRHVRDLRTEFLLKATLLDRRGDPLAPLLDAQEALLSPVLEALVADVSDVTAVGLWRRESATSAQRFFRRLRAELAGRPEALDADTMSGASAGTGPGTDGHADPRAAARQSLARVAAEARTGGAVLARTVELRGFGPDRPGESIVVVDGVVHGRLLGGACGAHLVATAERLLASGRDAMVTGCTVDAASATETGLTCGGTAKVLLQRLDTIPPLFWGDALGVPRASVTRLDGERAGATITFTQLGERQGSLGSDAADDVAAELAIGQMRWGLGGVSVNPDPDGDLLVDVAWSRRTLLVVGTGAIVTTLGSLATGLGWAVVATDDAVAALAYLDAAAPSDAVVVLSHDPLIDAPVLAAALRSPAGYVGALGSRRTQAARRERLVDAGIEPEDLARLSGPAGLDLGATGPPEIAVSIIAEIIAARSARTAAPLAGMSGPIQNRFRTT